MLYILSRLGAFRFSKDDIVGFKQTEHEMSDLFSLPTPMLQARIARLGA